MTIPESAIEFVEELAGATLAGLADDLADLAEELRDTAPRGTALRVAAVIEGHARAAQVEALRETADELDSFAGRLDGPAAVVARSCASIVRGKSRDMEAGAGQTGEGS